jgi:hypothetical protein
MRSVECDAAHTGLKAKESIWQQDTGLEGLNKSAPGPAAAGEISAPVQANSTRAADRPEVDAKPVAAGPVEETGLAETAVADIRETAQPDAYEHEDPEQLRRVPALAETRGKVERAQEAVAEIAAGGAPHPPSGASNHATTRRGAPDDHPDDHHL